MEAQPKGIQRYITNSGRIPFDDWFDSLKNIEQTMKNVKAPTNDSYQDYLISHLKDPNYAAVYLETHLEDDGFEPKLLQLALTNVSEALGQLKMSPEHAKLHRQRIDDLLSQPGSIAIGKLANWLNELGLKLTVTIDSQLQSD